ncbi:phage protein Gp27 family protein, partial [Methylobacterium aquaticum]|uniref:phage protein Gp27 family protein n=1 Tax=Methylobacterium aquaticum TaxID=270351 RepID=UPI003D1783DB
MRAEIPRHRVLDAADRAEARADRGPERRPGRGRLSSMDLIPEEGQDDIVWAVAELNKREKTANEILAELNDRLAAKDIDPISKSAFNRKSVKLAAMSNRLNEARHIFSGLAPQFTAEKVDEGTIVLGEFIKLLLFELAQNEGAAIGTKGAMELARAYLAAIQAQKI